MSDDIDELKGSRAILRDVTFSRGIADRVVVIDLGRDLELACLQVGPVLTSFTDGADADRFDGDPVYTETMRLRLPWYCAVSTAMEILEQGIKTDKIHGDKIAESLAEWIADSESTELEESKSDAI